MLHFPGNRMPYLLSLILPEEPYYAVASAKYNVKALENTRGPLVKTKEKGIIWGYLKSE